MSHIIPIIAAPIAIPKSIELKKTALASEAFILFENEISLHSVIDYACKKARFKPTVFFESIDEKSIIDLVSKNYGITILLTGINIFDFSIVKIKIAKKVSNLQYKLFGLKTDIFL